MSTVRFTDLFHNKKYVFTVTAFNGITEGPTLSFSTESSPTTNVPSKLLEPPQIVSILTQAVQTISVSVLLGNPSVSLYRPTLHFLHSSSVSCFSNSLKDFGAESNYTFRSYIPKNRR